MQDDLFSKLQPGKQGDIIFPVIDTQVHTGSSAAMHRFPQRKGVLVERTGADPLSGSMRLAFFTGLFNFPVKDLYPNQLAKLRAKVQEQQGFELVVPTVGTIPKAFVKINEAFTSTQRDGAFVTLEFTEEGLEDFTKPLLAMPYGAALDAAGKADQLLKSMGQKPDIEPEDNSGGPGVDFATAIGAAKLQLQFAQDGLAGPIRQFQNIAERASDLLENVLSLGDPSNWECRNALRDLKDSVNEVIYAFISDRQLLGFTIKNPMSAAAIAIETGNTIDEILRLNVIEDASYIEPGSYILFTKK